MNGKEEWFYYYQSEGTCLFYLRLQIGRTLIIFCFYIYLLLLFAAICWILYCLALHPEHQQKCQEEIDSIFKQNKELQW